MTELCDIPVSDLHAHPDNPRLRLRDDVVTQIAAEITRSGFGQEHALLVRPNADGYEILSGHHRHEAAKRCALETVPCWVRDMDDDEAFMMLILANTQGELSPLEEGHHVHYYVELGERLGRGRQGGLRDYARRLNKSAGELSKKRAAYEVYESVSRETLSSDQYSHLYEISKGPPESWGPLCSALVSRKWSVKDTARVVGEVAKFDIPDRHAAWLPQGQVTEAYLSDERPTPSAVQRLVDEADRVLEAIEREGDESDAAEFRAWLVANTGGESWLHRSISAYQVELVKRWAERRWQDDDAGIKHCRAGDLLAEADLEPGTADLVFTDPPYPVEFVECWTELGDLAVEALKPGGFLLAYTGQYTMLEAIDRLRDAGLTFFWCHAVIHDGAFFRMNATHVQVGWKPVLVFRNGPGDLPNWHKDIVTDGSKEKSATTLGNKFDGGTWQQSEAEAAYWISELSKPDDLVVDPFVGGGTTPAVCKQLGRRFVGCDIDEKAVQVTRERLVDG